MHSTFAFPVRYHGSQKDHHGTYLADWNDCDSGCRKDVPGWVVYSCLDLFDPETGHHVLCHVRERSVTRLAPDGTDLHRPARDGDLVRLPYSRAVVRYAYHERGPVPSSAYVHYYARSGRGWILSSLLVTGGWPIVRERYSSPAELVEWQLRMVLDEIAYRVEYPDLRDEIEAQADDLERWTQRREALTDPS
jgi:hypothetical protein